MSLCTDPEYGAMLHAWELGMLADEERQQFELHLLQCESCAEEAAQFAHSAKVLREDPELRPKADGLDNSGVEGSSERATTRRRITRVLLAAAVVLVVAIPVYRMFFSPHEIPIVVQKLNLIPVRGESNNSIKRIPNATLEIRFYVDGATESQTYRVSVRTQAGIAVYDNNKFNEFSESGVGLLILPMHRLDSGLYTLIVRSVADTSAVLQEYNFRIE